ncbi:hypothetical protein ACM66B_004776 [Microbotryomycetes sp. NB124-2]
MRRTWTTALMLTAATFVSCHSFNYDPLAQHQRSLGLHHHAHSSSSTRQKHSIQTEQSNEELAEEFKRGLELFDELLNRDVVALKDLLSDQDAPDAHGNFDKRALGTAFDYSTTKVRGVSLGGWLLLEPFITPGMFQAAHKQDSRVVDQYTLCKYTRDRSTLQKALVNHYKTFITEKDLQAIKKAGLNHVRIPVPFWAVNTYDTPYISTGVLYYLTWAVRWAGRNGIRVLIDLHGAPGAQNPWDNSGQQRQMGEKLAWTSSTNLARTKQVLQALVSKFTQAEFRNVVTAIQPVNEPYGEYEDVLNVLPQFYRDAYDIVRYPASGSTSNLMFSISDGFKGSGYWRGFMVDKPNVFTDQHIYSVFDNYLITLNTDQRVKYYCGFSDMMKQNAAGGHRPLIGEWTSAPTDCSQKIPGVSYSANDKSKGIGWGSRYDGTFPGSYRIGSCSSKTGDASKFSSGYKQILRRMYEVQTSVYEQGAGWIYWTWKTESGQSEDWSYSKGLQYGWIPSNPTEKKYGNQC